MVIYLFINLCRYLFASVGSELWMWGRCQHAWHFEEDPCVHSITARENPSKRFLIFSMGMTNFSHVILSDPEVGTSLAVETLRSWIMFGENMYPLAGLLETDSAVAVRILWRLWSTSSHWELLLWLDTEWERLSLCEVDDALCVPGMFQTILYFFTEAFIVRIIWGETVSGLKHPYACRSLSLWEETSELHSLIQVQPSCSMQWVVWGEKAMTSLQNPPVTDSGCVALWFSARRLSPGPRTHATTQVDITLASWISHLVCRKWGWGCRFLTIVTLSVSFSCTRLFVKAFVWSMKVCRGVFFLINYLEVSCLVYSL